MPNSLYARNESAWCPSCIAKGFHFRMNDSRHFTLHVPRDRWPSSMSEPRKARVVVNGLVLSPDDPRAQVEPKESESEFDYSDHVEYTPEDLKAMRESYFGFTYEGIDEAVSEGAVPSVFDGVPERAMAEPSIASETAITYHFLCECGWYVEKPTEEAKSAAIRMHRARAKQHQVVA